MTFFQKARLFLEPLAGQRNSVILSILLALSRLGFIFTGVYVLAFALAAVKEGDLTQLYTATFGFVGLSFFFLFLSYLLRHADWPGLEINLRKYLQQRYLDLFLRLDHTYTESIGVGKSISILTTGTSEWITALSDTITQGTKFVVTILILSYSLGQADTRTIGLLLGSIILIHYVIIRIDMRMHHYRRLRTIEKTNISRSTVRWLMSKTEILKSGRQAQFQDEIDETTERLRNIVYRLNGTMWWLFRVVDFFAIGLRVGVIILIGTLVIEGSFSLEAFATLMSLIVIVLSFLFDSTEFYKNFTKNFADIEKLWETFDFGPRMHGFHEGKVFLDDKKSGIEISDCSYGYGEKDIFSRLTLSLPRKKKIALVGMSGGGKTTLMKLIAGILQPQSGTISIFGNDLHTTALSTYFPHIGYLTQDPGIFDGTIRENLTASSRAGVEMTDDDIQKALDLAQCGFVREMAEGVETEIGERGVRLSGGQRQRLAIAKIFLSDPQIILLDEPTSALDSESEELITKALDRLFEGKTVIIIAHRLQTVKHADEILVIEHGAVVERGSHSELIERKGIYNRMLELQSGF